MRVAFLSLAERPSSGVIWIICGHGLTRGGGQMKGLEKSHSFLTILISDFGGEGDVGGELLSLGRVLGRPIILAIIDFRSGDLRKDSSSSADSKSVPVSEV